MSGGGYSPSSPRWEARFIFVRAREVKPRRVRRYGHFSLLCALSSPAKGFSSLHSAQRAQRSKERPFCRSGLPALPICARSLLPSSRPLATFSSAGCARWRRNNEKPPTFSRKFPTIFRNLRCVSICKCTCPPPCTFRQPRAYTYARASNDFPFFAFTLHLWLQCVVK